MTHNPIYCQELFEKSKSRDLLDLRCNHCNKIFQKRKKDILDSIKNNNRSTCEYCSRSCKNNSQKKLIELNCDCCGIKIEKQPNELAKTKNHFCSRSCAAIYNNAHKTKGTRRSKLELFLESQLSSISPNLNILYNEKSTINSELDIYIPSLNLAFELNGIFHYEPIYGQDKLDSIQNNDSRKLQACLEKNIELCIIDVSSLKYFKESNAKKFLDIITSIIEKKLALLSTS